MKRTNPITWGLLALLAAAPASAQAPAVKLQRVDLIKAGFYPSELALTTGVPAGVRKLPDLAKGALFGVLRFGPKGHETSYVLVVDEPEGQPARLYLDANRNGDLADDPALEWKAEPYKGGPEDKRVDLTMYKGETWVEVPSLGKGARVKLGLYRFDPKDPDRPMLRSSLIFHLDYALEGTVTLGGKTFRARLRDRHNSADFSRLSSPGKFDYPFLVDLSGEGTFKRKDERYEARQPFNIGGTTYEFTGWTPDGSKLAIRKSAQSVEALAAPAARVSSTNGDRIVPIQAQAIDGKAIDFPAAYPGKVVLLDFWATWCGPCLKEVPNLVKAYAAYHDRGFEILGVSLDGPKFEAKIQDLIRKEQMTWPQVYEGKGFNAKTIEQLGIQAIPMSYLVDGDSGRILAQGEELRGARLAPALEKALAAKRAKN